MEPTSEIILWASVLGLLVGIVWSLRYLVLIDRKIVRIEEKMEHIVESKRKEVSARK